MDNTKSVQLTADEIKAVINYLSYSISEKDNNNTNTIDRMKYLDKRLKDFSEPKPPKEAKTSW